MREEFANWFVLLFLLLLICPTLLTLQRTEMTEKTCIFYTFLERMQVWMRSRCLYQWPLEKHQPPLYKYTEHPAPLHWLYAVADSMTLWYYSGTLSSLQCSVSSQHRRSNLLLSIRRRGNLNLLSGEQHVPPLVDLPDESLCFSHTVVALPFSLQMLHLQEIQLGNKQGIETPKTQTDKNRDKGRQLGEPKQRRQRNKRGRYENLKDEG